MKINKHARKFLKLYPNLYYKKRYEYYNNLKQNSWDNQSDKPITFAEKIVFMFNKYEGYILIQKRKNIANKNKVYYQKRENYYWKIAYGDSK